MIGTLLRGNSPINLALDIGLSSKKGGTLLNWES